MRYIGRYSGCWERSCSKVRSASSRRPSRRYSMPRPYQAKASALPLAVMLSNIARRLFIRVCFLPARKSSFLDGEELLHHFLGAEALEARHHLVGALALLDHAAAEAAVEHAHAAAQSALGHRFASLGVRGGPAQG